MTVCFFIEFRTNPIFYMFQIIPIVGDVHSDPVMHLYTRSRMISIEHVSVPDSDFLILLKIKL